MIRVWGRIGGHQRVLVTPCASTLEAETLAAGLLRRRLPRGYQVVPGEIATGPERFGLSELEKQQMSL